MEGYDKLSFIDKLRFRWRVRQAEKLVEQDDRQPIDKGKIIRELIAERENKKKGVKALNSGEPQYKEPENKLSYIELPPDTIKNTLEQITEKNERSLDIMVGKELNSKEDAYENIVELQRFLSYPHDDIPNAADKANQKFQAIESILGRDILQKGMEIAEVDANLISMTETMAVQDRTKIESEIVKDPKLAEQLNYLRYNPQEAKKQTGEVVKYQAVYSKMIADMRDKQNCAAKNNPNKEGKNLNEQLIEKYNSGNELGDR